MAYGYSEKSKERAQQNLDKKAFPKLVTVTSKHSTDHYLATDKDSLLKIALYVFEINRDADFYSAYGKPFETIEAYIKEQKPLYRTDSGRCENVSVEQYAQWVISLDSGALNGLDDVKASIQKRVKEVKDSFNGWRESVEIEAFANKIVEEKDRLAAYLMLNSRSEYQYESFVVSDFDVIRD